MPPTPHQNTQTTQPQRREQSLRWIAPLSLDETCPCARAEGCVRSTPWSPRSACRRPAQGPQCRAPRTAAAGHGTAAPGARSRGSRG
eukprot:260941-Chlamydomonas_euryale.AAC.6